MAASKIDVLKKDWIICQSCFCTNTYFRGTEMTPFCYERSTFLCLSSSFSGVPKRAEDPKICNVCCPGLVVYPKVACFPKLKDLLEEADLKTTDESKHDSYVCGGMCLGDFAAGASYLQWPIPMDPLVICKSESIRFPMCCFAQDCVFPPATPTEIPMTFAPCCGLVLYPQPGCCKKVQDLYPEQDWSGAPDENSALLNHGGTSEVPDKKAEETAAEGEAVPDKSEAA